MYFERKGTSIPSLKKKKKKNTIFKFNFNQHFKYSKTLKRRIKSVQSSNQIQKRGKKGWIAEIPREGGGQRFGDGVVNINAAESRGKEKYLNNNYRGTPRYTGYNKKLGRGKAHAKTGSRREFSN